MTDKDIELNLEELDDVAGGAGVNFLDIPIKDLVEYLKLYPGIDTLKENIKNDAQDLINWAIENVPSMLYEKYSQYSISELKDYVTKYITAAVRLLAS